MLDSIKQFKLWDSILEFTVNISTEIQDTIRELRGEFIYDPVNKRVTVGTVEDNEDFPLSEAYNWREDGVKDYTCVAKGYFIQRLEKRLKESGKSNLDYYVNFGGDVLSNTPDNLAKVTSKYYPISVITKGRQLVFCSTNLERPEHIPDAKYEAVIFTSNEDPAGFFDIATTRALCNEEFNESGVLHIRDKKICEETYIASPFFNDTDVAIRDKMLGLFSDYIRPDLLNPNIEGDLHKDLHLAAKIRQDNLDAIDACSLLVFPKDTRDLGTLFEVGYAIRNGKKILRYDYVNDHYDWIYSPKIPGLPGNDVTLDLNRLGSGVMLGYHYEKNLACYLGTSSDNIMLMDNPHIEKPESLYPCYLPELLSESTYRLNTITSGS